MERRIYVLTLAGKQVWSSDKKASEADTSGLMGLCTAVLGLAQRFDGECPRSILAGDRRIVLYKRGELVLISVAHRLSAEAFVLRELELFHDAILMVLTGKVHKLLQSSPGYDVRELLGSSAETVLRSLAVASPLFALTGAVGTMRFWDPQYRAKLAHVLLSAQSHENCFAYGLVLCGDRLVGAIQPRGARLESTDLSLLANFVASQRSAHWQSESWMPICLPRFNSRGFVHAYVGYLDAAIELCLVLVAVDGSPETFSTLRRTRLAIEAALDRDGVLSHARKVAAQPDAATANLAQSSKALHIACCSRRSSRKQSAPPSRGGGIAQCFASPWLMPRPLNPDDDPDHLESSSSIVDPFEEPPDSDEPVHLWHAYQEIALRRRGLNVTQLSPRRRRQQPEDDDDESEEAILDDDIYEVPVLDASLVYITTAAGTHVGLSAHGLDLFATFPTHLSLLHVADRSQQLLNTIKHDEQAFFAEVHSY